MNLKSIRKNYDALSMRERFALYWKAAMRQDESEAGAVVAASPKLDLRVVDIAPFAEDVLTLHLLNLIERMNYAAMFEVFLGLSDDEDEERFERISDSLFLAGYLYTVETDAWNLIGDEFGFDVEDFRRRSAVDYPAVEFMNVKDEMMRKLAFTEEGIKKVAERNRMNVSELKTLETQKAKYREILTKAESKVT